MKKFEKLGKVLSKEEQKKIVGGNPPDPDLKECGNGCEPGPNSRCPETCPCTRRGNYYNCNYE